MTTCNTRAWRTLSAAHRQGIQPYFTREMKPLTQTLPSETSWSSVQPRFTYNLRHCWPPETKTALWLSGEGWRARLLHVHAGSGLVCGQFSRFCITWWGDFVHCHDKKFWWIACMKSFRSLPWWSMKEVLLSLRASSHAPLEFNLVLYRIAFLWFPFVYN